MTDAPTSRDVARLAGVAQSTVSYVLTGKGAVAPETRERVLRAAETLNYRPNIAARWMRTRRSGRLAVVMPIVSGNPARFLTGATEAAAAGGFSLEVHSLQGGPEARRLRTLEIIESGQYEGVMTPSLISATGDRDSTAPVVHPIAEFDDQMHGTGELIDARPLKELVAGLVAIGHRRFMHIAGAMDFASARERKRAYLDAINNAGVESVAVVTGEWTAKSGYDAVRHDTSLSPPLAVIAANDSIATGAIRAAIERGWRVPADVSVTGWDNLPGGEYQVPSLTTVDIDFETLGLRVVERLIAEIRDAPPPPQRRVVQRVIWRESTGEAGSA